MHKPFFILIVFCLTTTIAKGQTDIKSFVKENTISISTIQPDSTNYDDLLEFGKAVGDSKIVMLGEQDHGDAPAFLAKTRLIKYLHDKKGFNVLAFESDFFALNYGWDNLEKKENLIDSFLKKNIFGLWTLCDACQELFHKTIPKSFETKNPITITGFDNQMYLQYSYKNLSKAFDSVLRKLDLPITRTADYQSRIIALIDSTSKASIITKDEKFYDLLLEQFGLIKSQLKDKIDSTNFWSIMVDNLLQNTLELKYLKKDYYKGSNARDFQMTKNLSWLSDIKFPNEKIIVWAHNFHISKFGGHYSENFLNNANSMGNEFTKDSIKKKYTYILGFTSYNGKAGRLSTKNYKVEKPEKNSFENWVNPLYNYAFIDFRKFNQNNSIEFSMKGSIKGTHRNHSAQWAQIFDGVFFIRNMYPCTFVK